MKPVPKYEWQPTTAEIAAAAGIPVDAVERFDHNTSPFPTPWAADVVSAYAGALNEYPAASYRPLREAVGRARRIDPDWVVPGAGADELILLAARALLGPGAGSVSSVPTYTLYRIATAQVGADWVPVPCDPPDFRFPAGEVIARARNAEITWLCVPANPVGNRPTDEEVAATIAATDGVVVVDAAYAEFADDSWTDAVERHHNLIVLHTMSKAYGIGGARVGYALAHPDLIAAIDGVRPPGSISTLSAALAIEALENPERMDATVAELSRLRGNLASRLEALDLRVLPSQTNFVLCEVGPRAFDVEQHLMRLGLVVRRFPAGGPLEHYLRFTVRTQDAHDRLIDALERSL